ncbi:uncharacterized zinc finger CCHC domain-containing protein At4g19190 [Ipomoea triloba]|uniref:uncharacterized zinc finger CCHC domain-containing protein At4g19190 n=1 Tax=Ipomoea triloba TaxID=35885 RepID=UPI00125E4FB4|nr:uncharacterized zinc finger CCHC domain-containing protein At4g19190 [Ipomoea triloba]
MEEEEGGGPRLSKRFSDKDGEVDYKTKAGTAWSHSFLNQKPWHPLSYPNQRRKWIAEQTHSQKERRAEEISREYAQEQDFFRQTALVSKKEKEKLEMMKAVSFMYVRPPGYNPESAKAAEVEDERKKQEQVGTSQSPTAEGASNSKKPESMPPIEEKKKPRPKDVFGRLLPTEEQFEVLKNAPRLETGAPARVKPFAIEIRNVKCVRCGNFGHQSGDRECPLKDAIMPNEESRLKRDDPLTAILAQTESSEPLKWELKQKPGLSPPRGGFRPDDPNQQIVAEDIFDEYGGFLAGNNIPDLLLSNFSSKPKKKKKSSKSKHKRRASPTSSDSRDHEETESSSDDDDRGRRSKKRRHFRPDDPNQKIVAEDIINEYGGFLARDNIPDLLSNFSSKTKKKKSSKSKHKRRASPASSDSRDHEETESSSDDDRRRRSKKRHKKKSRKHSESSSSSEDSNSDRHRKRSTKPRHSRPSSSRYSDSAGKHKRRDHHHNHHHHRRRHDHQSDSLLE